MQDNLDEDRTEGPEGYFVRSATPPQVPTERRRSPGRRQADAELVLARKRLLWAYAALSAVLAVGVLVVAGAWMD